MDDMVERHAEAITRYTVGDAPTEKPSWRVRDGWSKGLVPRTMSIHEHELNALKSAARLNTQNLHAALTPADLAKLAERYGMAVVPTDPDANILDALYGPYLSELAHGQRIKAYHAMLAARRIKPS